MTRQDMKRNARIMLGDKIFGNRWMTALLVCLIASAITAGAGAVVPGLGAMIIVGPMTYGVKKIFLKQARDNQDMKLGDILSGFQDDFSSTFLLGLMSCLFIILWALLLIIPGIIKSYAYEMIFYIKADHPEYDWRQCLKASEEMMKGHKWQLFMLDLSFIGWYIVGTMCLGVGDLWVFPYHEAAKAQFYLDLCGTAKRIWSHEET